MLDAEHLRKTFRTNDGESISAVSDISFAVEKGQIFTLLGPSGCGKSTTLRMIAGLELPDDGEIRIDGELVHSASGGERVSANRRKLGMVFQSYAIWPHMTVFQNAAFPLHAQRRARGFTRSQISDRVSRVLHAVALDNLEDRNATQLSGGQQQRLALARAIVIEPKVILLDEPLSNLDAKLRERMRAELLRLQREIGVTVVYVTHDQIEALALSDKIAVMDNGRILQTGTPKSIYEKPESNFVAQFVGKTNTIEGRVVEAAPADGKSSIDTKFGRLILESGEILRAGDVTKIIVRPEHVHVHQDDIQNEYHTRCTIESREYFGAFQEVILRAENQLLLAHVPATRDLVVGQIAFVRIDPERCVIVD